MLRAGLIGAGSMGRNHARVYTEMEDAELVAVADTDQESLNKIAQRQGFFEDGALLFNVVFCASEFGRHHLSRRLCRSPGRLKQMPLQRFAAS